MKKRGNRFKHGLIHTKEYASWCHMLQRCENPKDAAYSRYGGRGIKVCAAWHDFRNFIKDMGFCPEGLTLDRFPDNDGHYERKNCRWATPSQQAFNRRPYKLTLADLKSIRRSAAMGEQQKQIAARFGVDQSHISRIVNRQRCEERG